MSQLPTPQNNAPQQNTPDIISSICEDPALLGAFSSGGPGGSGGGVYQDISDGEIVNRIENTYLPANSDRKNPQSRITGTIEKFVLFNGKIIPVEIAVYLRPMIEAAARDGVTINVTSGFRDMATQTDGWNRKPNLWAPPGWSPHQRGYAVDMNTIGGGRYEWLVKNAYRYGFIRTVQFERWHWEYRGNWAGQQKPTWANDGRWKQLSQFSTVPRYHTLGVTGSKVMPSDIRWGGALGDRHPDRTTGGKTNTWFGEDGEHIPNKLDRISPGWDKLGPAALPLIEPETETPST